MSKYAAAFVIFFNLCPPPNVIKLWYFQPHDMGSGIRTCAVSNRTSSELYNVVREMVVCMHWGGGGGGQSKLWIERTYCWSPVQEACLDDWL